MLYLINKQIYKPTLPKNAKIYIISWISLLKQDSIRKKQIDKNVTELNIANSRKYKIEIIWNNMIYLTKFESSHLSGFYYLIV